MNNIATLRAEAPLALQMPEAEVLAVLRTSLYPGASDQSIKMVLGYCKAASLDPMMKPVHIVPMWDKNANAMRDVIMPGIGLYRTQAARSGELAGIGEPVFGESLDLDLGGVKVTVPDWCSVTVKRLVDGQERSFTAREYWIENYATAKKDTLAPNSMWKKRPRGQIAKCAQAQALRMAFPEMTGSQPTADEMEGKRLDADEQVIDEPAKPEPPVQPTWPDDAFAKRLPQFRKAIADGKPVADVIAWAETKGKLTDAQIAEIKAPAAPTYAQVADKLNGAKTADELAEAATLILAVADEGQRVDLTMLHDERAAMQGEVA